MAYLTNLASVLRAHGLDVVEIAGWRERGRPGDFRPVGVLMHHTGSYDALADAKDDLSYANWLAKVGRSDLPAPLCQLSISREGVVYVCAAGRANHAGKARESGTVAAGDGNELYIGIECMNDGKQGWSKAQRDAMVKTAAALCLDVTGNSAQTVRAHKETSVTGKWDPGLLDMVDFRADVAAVMLTARKPAKPKSHTRWTTAETYVHATPGGKMLRLLPAGYKFGVVTGSGKDGWIKTTSGNWVRGAKTTKTRPAPTQPTKAPKGVPSKWAKFAHFTPYSKNNSPAGLELAQVKGFHAIDLDFQMTVDGFFFNAHWATLRDEKLTDPRGEIPTSARLDSLTWAQIKRLRRKDGSRLHSAGTMLRLAAKRGLRVEVEAKATAASVRHGMGDVAAWRRLKTAADKAGCEVQVKILTDFADWPRVLKAAHAAGLVTILLPRGSRRVSKRHWPYIDYHRGAVVWTA